MSKKQEELEFDGKQVNLRKIRCVHDDFRG